MTARELITGSFRLIGVIGKDETPDAADMMDALSALNQMVDGWSTRSLMIPTSSREQFDLVSAQQLYSIGVGGNFNTSRPMHITDAAVKIAGIDSEIMIEVFNKDRWAGISNKSMQSQLPSGIFYNPEFPLGKIYAWPIPSEANKIILYSEKPLSSFATLDTEILMAPGSIRALRFNLAVEIAPEYEKEPSARVQKTASDTLSDLMRVNKRPSYMVSDAYAMGSSRGRYDIFKGE